MKSLTATLLLATALASPACANEIRDIGTGATFNVYGAFDNLSANTGNETVGYVSVTYSIGNLPRYDMFNPSSFVSYHVVVRDTAFVDIEISGCNEFDAHCGQSNRNQGTMNVYGVNGVGIESVGGFDQGFPVGFDITVTLYDGYSFTDPTAAVPEPSTWAMLLIGFAGVSITGWRRRRTVPA